MNDCEGPIFFLLRLDGGRGGGGGGGGAWRLTDIFIDRRPLVRGVRGPLVWREFDVFRFAELILFLSTLFRRRPLLPLVRLPPRPPPLLGFFDLLGDTLLK